MKITIGEKHFTAVLYDNPTAASFKSMLPLTLNMIELNGNEKYSDLAKNLTTNPVRPGRIETGDLMIYGSNTLVVFYKSFPTPYSYTPLGRIENTTGLKEALGDENISISFKLE